MSSVNYTGRLVDLLFFQGTQPQGETQVALALFPDQVTTGIQKVCQTFALLFLTEKGTLPYQPLLGSDFISAMRRGELRDEAAVQLAFNVAATVIVRTMGIEARAQGLPDDEVITDAQLTRFLLDKKAATLKLYATLTTQAGAQREVFLPVTSAIQ